MVRKARSAKGDFCSSIGQRLSNFRRARGMTLAEIADVCGVSEATMSRIETGQTDISAHHLFILARELGADISEFFSDRTSPLGTGMRCVTRRGEAEQHTLARYMSEVLGAEITNKVMHPAINHITAETLEEVGGMASHPGEEFLYVLDGTVAVHSELYIPLVLNKGDSLYFEGSMKHGYLKAGDETAIILVVVVPKNGQPA